MKVIAINGSPRRNWNTDLLCQEALKGAASCGAEVELIHLYDYCFKGCISCMACHLKTSMDQYLCFYKDELTPVLQKCLDADVLIIGSPIYYGQVTGMVRSLMERFLFPLDTYAIDENGHRITKRKKIVPSAFIYTMNANETQLRQYGMDQRLRSNEKNLKGILGHCESMYCCDTYQVNDYSRYTVTIFAPEHKRNQKEIQFPLELQKAYNLGQHLVELSKNQNN